MKLLFLSIVLAVSVSAAAAGEVLPLTVSVVAQSFSASAMSASLLPEAKGRKGSTRVGGSNSKGKGSRYVGGRR